MENGARLEIVACQFCANNETPDSRYVVPMKKRTTPPDSSAFRNVYFQRSLFREHKKQAHENSFAGVRVIQGIQHVSKNLDSS